MTEPWQMSLRDFIGSWPVKDPASRAESNADDRQLESEIEEGTEGWSRVDMRRTSARNFFIAEVLGTDSDVALVCHDPEEGSWDVCGGYVGPSLWIAPGARGRGLAAELVAAKADLAGGVLEPVSYTSPGLAAHVAGHRLAVRRALREGHRVPAHVLADYPEFAPAGRPRRVLETVLEDSAPGPGGPGRR